MDELPPSAPADPDAAIVAVLAGDTDAYARVVDRYEGPVRRWLAVRSPPQLEFEELAHRVFITAYEHLGDYRPGSDLLAWLLAIARHHLLAECKRLRVRERHRAGVAREFLLRAQETETGEQDERLEREGKALRECVGRLTPTARALIHHRYADDLPLARIATATGRSLGAIKKAMFEIRARLKDCIRQRLEASGR